MKENVRIYNIEIEKRKAHLKTVSILVLKLYFKKPLYAFFLLSPRISKFLFSIFNSISISKQLEKDLYISTD